MPTRRELHEQVRSLQRHQLQAAKADNFKPAIVGIGARDPQTGLFDVLLPDGSTEIGEKQFNSSLPQGSQVLGVPKETGNWVLDEQDVTTSPISPVVEAMGTIKYLYSIKNSAGLRELYLGGHQRQSKLLATFAKLTGTPFTVSTLASASLDNLGGKQWHVNLLRTIRVGDVMHPDIPGYYYSYSLHNLEKLSASGNEVFQVASLGLNFTAHGSKITSLGYDFWQNGIYRHYTNGLDFGAYTDNPFGGLNLNLYSLAHYQSQRFSGSASAGIPSVDYPYIVGTWEYFALPRGGTPLILQNASLAHTSASGLYGNAVYATIRINRSGMTGIGYLNAPGYLDTEANFAPVWYDDDGATVIENSSFATRDKLVSANNYFDLDDNRKVFYTFPKASLDITKAQKISVETYSNSFEKLSEKTFSTFKASKLGADLIVHQASFHP